MGAGVEVRESGTKGYLRAFSGARYAQDRGFGFGPEAAGTCENRTKEETRYWIEYLRII